IFAGRPGGGVGAATHSFYSSYHLQHPRGLADRSRGSCTLEGHTSGADALVGGRGPPRVTLGLVFGRESVGHHEKHHGIEKFSGPGSASPAQVRFFSRTRTRSSDSRSSP